MNRKPSKHSTVLSSRVMINGQPTMRISPEPAVLVFKQDVVSRDGYLCATEYRVLVQVNPGLLKNHVSMLYREDTHMVTTGLVYNIMKSYIQNSVVAFELRTIDAQRVRCGTPIISRERVEVMRKSCAKFGLDLLDEELRITGFR